MRSPSLAIPRKLTLFLIALLSGLAHGAVEPPPPPEEMSEIKRAAAIAVYEDLIASSSPIQSGDLESELLERLGEPEGTMAFGNKKKMDYGRGYVIVSEGRVTKIEDIPAERLASPDVEAYGAYQRALGMVHYMDRWMTAEESKKAYNKALEARQRELERINSGKQQALRRAERIAREEGGLKNIRQNGARISEQQLIVPGKFTVVDFYADWCAPCRAIDPYLKELAKDPRVAVRKVDIVNWDSPVSKQWNLRSIPNMRVYDTNGRQLGKPTANLKEIVAYINQSMQR